MPTIHFMGKVHPPGLRVTIDDLLPQHFERISDRSKTSYLVRIIESHIGVEAYVENLGEDISEISNRALELARSALDAFCFNKGWGLSATLDVYIDVAGIEHVLVPVSSTIDFTDRSYTANTTHVGTGLNILYRQMASNIILSTAINDLIVAITLPRTAEIGCARAVEGIRTLMTPPDMERVDGWPIMREKLNLSESYLRFITDVSKKPRHGSRVFIEPSILSTLIARAWKIMERYLAFEQRGNGLPLPVEDFPMLNG
jgi:hypothetical protein